MNFLWFFLSFTLNMPLVISVSLFQGLITWIGWFSSSRMFDVLCLYSQVLNLHTIFDYILSNMELRRLLFSEIFKNWKLFLIFMKNIEFQTNKFPHNYILVNFNTAQNPQMNYILVRIRYFIVQFLFICLKLINAVAPFS